MGEAVMCEVSQLRHQREVDTIARKHRRRLLGEEISELLERPVALSASVRFETEVTLPVDDLAELVGMARKANGAWRKAP